ncbi:unnamed protein product [Rhizopus stolonifer]
MNHSNKNESPENYPVGQDAWNRSKESKEHPELHSTGYGTVDREWSEEEEQQKKETKKKTKHKPTQRASSKEGFGHTVAHEHAPRSIKRDLNNI